MDFTFIKVKQGEGYEDDEILFSTSILEKLSLDQLAVLYEEVRNRINKRVEEG